VRVTTAFNRVLNLPGASVVSVAFTDRGLVLGVRRRARRHRCPCGTVAAGRYDCSRRRWRHLDFGACPVWLEADIARVRCSRCRRVRTEQVPWARPGARHTRDFEDVIAWLAQRMDKTSVSRLLRCSWETVDRAVKRVVADHLDDTRLNDLYRLGVDEISYKRGHEYLTVVADHDTGAVVWVAPGRTKQAFTEFFDALGPERRTKVEAVTLDASSIYLAVTREHVPHARICLDPFHIMKWTNEALDAVYRAEPGPAPEWNGLRWSRKTWRLTRTALRTGHERLTDAQLAMLTAVRRHRRRLYRAWELKEDLRQLYRTVGPHEARAHLNAWITAALRSQIPAMRHLARKLRRHADEIVAAVELGLSNSRLEGINAKIRVIQRRGYGHPDAASLTAMIYLCIGGIDLTLPTQR
jgi:transposase